MNARGGLRRAVAAQLGTNVRVGATPLSRSCAE